jgi:hypothetical protein
MIVPRPWNAGTDGSPPYVMGARMHAPSAAALASMDSHAGAAATPASMNRFLYAEGDPASLVDPTGHTTILVDVAGSTITRIGSTVVTNGPGTETGRVVAQAAATEQSTKAAQAAADARNAAHTGERPADPTAPPSAPAGGSGCAGTGDCQSPWWAQLGFPSQKAAMCSSLGSADLAEADGCSRAEALAGWKLRCAKSAGDPSCLLGSPPSYSCGTTCAEVVSYVDPTGISNAYLAIHYCGNGQAFDCAANLVAIIPLAGLAEKDAVKLARLGVSLDANVLIAALKEGRLAEVDAIIGGRVPQVSPKALEQFGVQNDPAEALAFLSDRGGGVGPLGTTQGAQALQQQLRALWKKGFAPRLREPDALIAHSAQQAGVPVLTNDWQMFKNLQKIGVPVEYLPNP